jgi:hypothetical protein
MPSMRAMSLAREKAKDQLAVKRIPCETFQCPRCGRCSSRGRMRRTSSLSNVFRAKRFNALGAGDVARAGTSLSDLSALSPLHEVHLTCRILQLTPGFACPVSTHWGRRCGCRSIVHRLSMAVKCFNARDEDDRVRGCAEFTGAQFYLVVSLTSTRKTSRMHVVARIFGWEALRCNTCPNDQLADNRMPGIHFRWRISGFADRRVRCDA